MCLDRTDQLDRKRMTWWIPWLFVIGLCFSALGLFTSIAWIRDGGAVRFTDIVFAFFFVFFGLCVGAWLLWPFRIKPRIVPYFAREIEPYDGKTSTAFARGRGLYREIVALDQLAGTLGVRPLSAVRGRLLRTGGPVARGFRGPPNGRGSAARPRRAVARSVRCGP